MGLFEKKVYKKDNKGNWKLVSSKVEKAPHDVGRWEQSRNLEKKSSLGEKSFIDKKPTFGGLSQKVTEIRTYFGNDEKVVRTLITTSNRLPKSYKRGES